MKTFTNFIIILLIFGAIMAQTMTSKAAPILNENYAVSSFLIVYKDSEDPNLYYFAPQYLGVCTNERGYPIFNYSEYRDSWLSPSKGVVMLALCLRYHKAEMRDALLEIKKQNPNAKFAGVAFSTSELALNDSVIKNYVEANSCSHVGGVIGAELACGFVLSPKGKSLFVDRLKAGVSIVLQFSYGIDGVIRTAKGFENGHVNFGVVGYVTKNDFNKIATDPASNNINVFP